MKESSSSIEGRGLDLPARTERAEVGPGAIYSLYSSVSLWLLSCARRLSLTSLISMVGGHWASKVQ